eukprot:TRINITY_DN641_c0_g2_i1.p4 TRINITY_DN641_c0_g2~~TRINITY_DN641_c0_g2_i1.p4  ORF type:complete len:142 (-),score=11.93 TRINITY_DN641_c0_g2_i1:107-511(-)
MYSPALQLARRYQAVLMLSSRAMSNQASKEIAELSPYQQMQNEKLEQERIRELTYPAYDTDLSLRITTGDMDKAKDAKYPTVLVDYTGDNHFWGEHKGRWLFGIGLGCGMGYIGHFWGFFAGFAVGYNLGKHWW